MDAGALSVLRENASWIQKTRAQLRALENGQNTEICRLLEGGAPPSAAWFRDITGSDGQSEEYARLCRAALTGVRDPAILSSLLPDTGPAEETSPDIRTAYLHNAYSDRAFTVFSERIGRLSAQYQPSFSAACEEVYYGRCSFCILPLRTSEDGILNSFFRLCAKHDLRLALVCDVPLQDRDGRLRFALLRRGLRLYAPENGFFQATVILPPELPIGKFLRCCEETGAGIERVTTLPLTYTDEIASFCVSFSVTPASLAPLMLFLRTALETYTPDGIYEICGGAD